MTDNEKIKRFLDMPGVKDYIQNVILELIKMYEYENQKPGPADSGE